MVLQSELFLFLHLSLLLHCLSLWFSLSFLPWKERAEASVQFPSQLVDSQVYTVKHERACPVLLDAFPGKMLFPVNTLLSFFSCVHSVHWFLFPWSLVYSLLSFPFTWNCTRTWTESISFSLLSASFSTQKEGRLTFRQIEKRDTNSHETKNNRKEGQREDTHRETVQREEIERSRIQLNPITLIFQA